jgi:hypothetical protein
MRVALPHTLPHEELRRRFHARSDELKSLFPEGLAQVTQEWRDEDHLDMVIIAMGQRVVGLVELQDQSVVVNVDLPPALGFVERIIESTIRDKTQKLLK